MTKVFLDTSYAVALSAPKDENYQRADGSIERQNAVSLTLTSDSLIRQVQVMLLNFGIVSSRGIKRGRYRGRPHLSHRLVIAGAEVDRFTELIGFAVQRKCSLGPPRERNANVDLIAFVGAQLHSAMRGPTTPRFR